MGEKGQEGQSYKVTCASCGRETLEVWEVYSEIPRFGRMVIVSMLCPRCGYRANDSISLENKGPQRIEYRVAGPADLSSRVIRSQSGHVIIPELGLELMPGPKSEAFITNVEGLLVRFLEIARQLETSPDGSGAERARASAEAIERAIEGEAPFTLVIEDELGNSAVIPSGQEKGR